VLLVEFVEERGAFDGVEDLGLEGPSVGCGGCGGEEEDEL